MAIIAIVGKSGTGKTTSFIPNEQTNIKGLPPDETLVINVANKPLNIKGWKKIYKPFDGKSGNLLNTKNPITITKTIDYVNKERPDIKYIVIDDAQYIMAFEYMDKANIKDYDKFVHMGQNIFRIIEKSMEVRDDLIVIFLWHPDIDRDSQYKMKTVGKMIDDYITLEGLFNTVIYSTAVKEGGKIKYFFVTNFDGVYPAKTPPGMFDSLYIPNDLGIVVNKFKKFNEE